MLSRMLLCLPVAQGPSNLSSKASLNRAHSTRSCATSLQPGHAMRSGTHSTSPLGLEWPGMLKCLRGLHASRSLSRDGSPHLLHADLDLVELLIFGMQLILAASQDRAEQPQGKSCSPGPRRTARAPGHRRVVEAPGTMCPLMTSSCEPHEVDVLASFCCSPWSTTRMALGK